MCHSWVKRLIHWDKKKKFHFAPLEGETAKNTLAPLLPNYLLENTIIYTDGNSVYLRSEAALRILSELGFPFKIFTSGLMIPKKIRDGVYNSVANRRYHFGPRYESCPLPPAGWKDRFLD